ncbi:hypothetical protein KHA80_15305 [Anaerobacillus sp. HL2]|nr:hypothetical protein KHA80_15305 [Anaerobacillus sp. HL2]
MVKHKIHLVGLFFGYIFASIIGYFVALMIMKNRRVLTKWKGYMDYLSLLCV